METENNATNATDCKKILLNLSGPDAENLDTAMQAVKAAGINTNITGIFKVALELLLPQINAPATLEAFARKKRTRRKLQG